MVNDMTLIDFNDSSQTAFTKAFLKGLAAPVMLFGMFDMPDCVRVPMIPPHDTKPAKSITDDMETVMNDFIKAVHRTK